MSSAMSESLLGSKSSQASDVIVDQLWTGGFGTTSFALCGTRAIDEGMSTYLIGGAFFPDRRFEGSTMQK